MSLHERERGYAVMSPDLSGYSIESPHKELCIEYCRNDDVVVERIPSHAGFQIVFYWNPLSIRVSKKYFHKCGKIVHRNHK